MRFAGPRLEKAGDALLPVPLRTGGRSLGGALSWSSPQALASFDENSPFAGLTIPADVTVNRQVLADPAQLTPEVEIWARLKDGTPLVTATKYGNGRLVLFHVTANSDWSNLPISGLFVEMLRRLSTMGTIGASGQGGGETRAGTTADASANANVLAPMKTLDGQGTLRTAPPTAEPIKASELQTTSPSFEHPPGYYGQSASPRALNILTPKSTLTPFPDLPASVTRLSYADAASTALKPSLLGAALALLFADIIAIILLQAGGLGGLFSRRARPRAGAVSVGTRGTRLCSCSRRQSPGPAAVRCLFVAVTRLRHGHGQIEERIRSRQVGHRRDLESDACLRPERRSRNRRSEPGRACWPRARS